VKFKVGDKVRSIKHPKFGLGKVVSVTGEFRDDQDHPVEVAWEDDNFNKKHSTCYTTRGEQGKEVMIKHVTPLEQLL
jgi:hypothetical protein